MPVRDGEGSVFDDVPAVRAWYLRAVAAEARGDRAEADRAMGWMLRQGRGWATTWVQVGDYRLRTDRAAEAVPAYFEALARDPDHGPAHVGLARAWLATGHLGDAWAEVEAARALDARGVEAVAVEVARRRGDGAAALDALARWRAQPAIGAERLARADAALALERSSWARDDLAALRGHPTLGDAAAERLAALEAP